MANLAENAKEQVIEAEERAEQRKQEATLRKVRLDEAGRKALKLARDAAAKREKALMSRMKDIGLGDVPALGESKAYQTAFEKDLVLKTRLNEVEAQLEDIHAVTRGAATQLPDTLTLEAQALLGDTVAADTAGERKGLTNEREVLKRAIALHSDTLREEREKAAREIRRAATPAYTKLLKVQAKAARDLLESIKAQEEFRDALESMGISAVIGFNTPLNDLLKLRIELWLESFDGGEFDPDD